MQQEITVLIVEDNPDDYYLLQEILESSAEIEAILFHEGLLEGALSAAENKEIDVAIVDLSLPDSFGLDTFVSFHERYPMIPTIIMTGARDLEMAYKAVRKGAQDYLFKSELSSSAAIIRSIRYAIERQRLTTDLRKALAHVKQLQGMLPICSICKNVRNDQGYWNSVEAYLYDQLEVAFSHSICPDCAKKHYSEFLKPKD